MHSKLHVLTLCKLLNIGLILLLLSACGTSKEDVANPNVLIYKCGAENLVVRDGLEFFESNGLNFKGKNARSQEEVFEGKYSIKLDTINKYGFGTVFTEVQAGEYFEITVWKKSKNDIGNVIAASENGYSFKAKSSSTSIIEEKDGWKKLFLSFTATVDLEKLNVYVFSGGAEAYFDNIEIKRFKERPMLDIPDVSTLEIVIPDSNYKELQGYVNSAIQEHIIESKYKKYVKGFILLNGDSLPMKIRLKGDWADHLTGGKISYRIKLAKGYAYKGIRSFSVQHPSTRNYLNEWFAHKLCEREDILTTKYEFIPLKMNGLDLGVYAMEEHFDKQLLESRNRREGPILKFDESGAWAKAFAESQMEEKLELPYFESSMVSCFKKKRTTKSPILSSQFSNGAVLLNLFKNGYDQPENLFNLKKLARQYALFDLLNVHHGLAWHNRRFYYDPVSGNLEQIAFDLLPGSLPMNQTLAMNQFLASEVKNKPEGVLDHYVFLNEEFRQYYIENLRLFSSEAYLKLVLKELEADLVKQEKLIESDFRNYSMDIDFYYKKAALIREELVQIEGDWDDFNSKFAGKSHNSEEIKYEERKDDFFLKEISINAYLTKNADSTFTVEIENYHVNPVEICGFSFAGNTGEITSLEETAVLNGLRRSTGVDSKKMTFVHHPKKVFFKVENDTDSLISKKVINWERPGNSHPRIELKNKFQKRSPFYSIEENTVIFGRKATKINELIYVPSKYKVRFDPNSKIDFVNGGGLIINNSLQMIGEVSEGIKLFSSDSSSMGITVMNAESVEISNVEIIGFNTLNYKGWTLTGAVTIYEVEDVKISNLKVSKNLCEDALNIVRSNFVIEKLTIEETLSDGFDADFCSGSLSSSVFNNTGNDCIDFSGSVIKLNDITISNSGDKGISAGERSSIQFENVRMNGAGIGVASKDESKVVGQKIDLRNIDIDFIAFVKKPEYNKGSLIDVDQVKLENRLTTEWFELGSVVTINGKSYEGTEKLNVEYP